MLVIVCRIHTLEGENRSKRDVYTPYSNLEFPKPYAALNFFT